MRSKMPDRVRRRAGAGIDRRLRRWRPGSSEAAERARPDHDLVLEQPRGNGLGQGRWSQEWNADAPRPEGHRAGDPGRQDLRGGHRCRDHRRQRAVPDLQHLARPRCRSSRSRAASSRSTPSPARKSTSRSAPATSRSSTTRRTGSTTSCRGSQNPVMIFYNKNAVRQGRARHREPAAEDLRRVPRHQPASSSTARAAEPRSARRRRNEFFQSWFDFYPLYAAESGGKQTRRGRQGDVRRRRAARRSPSFWRDDVRRPATRRKETYTGDAFVDGKSRDGRRRSVGDRGLQGTRSNWGVVPGADLGRQGRRARSTPSPTRRTSAIYSACKNQRTAWDVLKFATSEEQDGKLLEATGQMPLRTDLAHDVRRLLQREPGLHDVRRPGRRAPSRCRTCRTRSRSGRTFRDDYSPVGDLRQEDSRVDDGRCPLDGRRRRPTSSPDQS